MVALPAYACAACGAPAEVDPIVRSCEHRSAAVIANCGAVVTHDGGMREPPKRGVVLRFLTELARKLTRDGAQ